MGAADLRRAAVLCSLASLMGLFALVRGHMSAWPTTVPIARRAY
jgi:hypothetical protein